VNAHSSLCAFVVYYIYTTVRSILLATFALLRILILKQRVFVHLNMSEDEHPINSKGWTNAYPAPSERSDCPLLQMSIEELDVEMASGSIPGKDYIVVDVRRADCLVSNRKGK
jgi:hypothetical protein